jgi:hypothetical protein
MSARSIKLLAWGVAFGCYCFRFAASAQDTPLVTPPSASQLGRHSSDSGYFPEGVFNSPDGSDNHPTEGLVNYLQTIGEPSLLKLTEVSGVQVYRLIWMGSLTGKTVVLRLAIVSNGAAKLFITETAYDGTIVLKKEDSISAATANAFVERIKIGDFWQLPTRERTERLTKDGTAWIFEGVRRDDYHVVYRRNPEPGRFTDIGRYLAKDMAQLGDSTIKIPPGGPAK